MKKRTNKEKIDKKYEFANEMVCAKKMFLFDYQL